MISNLFISKSKFEDDIRSEKPLRSVMKAVSWRVIGTLDTLLVSYIVLGEVKLASAIASVDFLSKFVLYFLHERMWNQIKWNR